MEETNEEELKSYARACTEVLAVLKEAPEEDIAKIPTELLNALEEKKDKDYVFETNSYMSLENEDLSDVAKVILMQIFKDYIFKTQSSEENEEIKEIENTEEQNEEIENETTETALVEVKKVPLYQKIINFFKKLFHFNKREEIIDEN